MQNNIPELLVSLSGQKIDTLEKWERFRRDEVLNLSEQYAYGVRDIERPENLYFKIEEEKEVYGMKLKEVRIGFDDYSFPMHLYLPLKIEKPVPAFVYVMHENLENKFQFKEDGNMSSSETMSELPLKHITDRGYAVAVMPTRDIYREWTTHSEFKVGVFSAVKIPKGRNKSSWASLSSWAWGVSRVIDYLETDADVDATRVASIGHSRSGKAALWAGCTDPRIYLTIANNSGCMGAAILRGKKGEHAKEINISDWLNDKFHEYNDCEEYFPIDQHFVLSLVAPRYLCLPSSVLDEWADPEAELLAAKLTTPVYELYGEKGLVMDDEKPVLNKVYDEGRIVYYVKEGDHSQTMFDWNVALDYFDKIK